jgi:hypothetical protein
MTASIAAEFRSSSISKASLRALIASWLGWMFDGYETYALVLVYSSAPTTLSTIRAGTGNCRRVGSRTTLGAESW